MNALTRPAFALPGDPALIEAALALPGGLAAVTDRARPNLQRAIAGLGVTALIGLAEKAELAGRVALYRAWLMAHPAGPESWIGWFNLAVTLLETGEFAAAAASAEEAQRLRPDLWQATITRAQAFERMGDAPGALAAVRRSLPDREGRRELHNQLGRMLEQANRLGEAQEELRASLLIDPAQPDVVQHAVHGRQRMAQWPVTALEVPGLPEATAALQCGPLATLALHDDPRMQAQVAADWIARKVAPPQGRLSPPEGYAHDRIRIGYLSSDFCRHAMSFLIAELLELHDRSRFEVYGYCSSPEDGSDIRARVLAALDHHVPVGALTDAEAAARIRADEIDILIDLNGLTKGARLGILRWKPAPVQATYLGYIGPVPLPELDWLICDAITVPPGRDEDYQPRPLRIEGCYQANDGREPVLPEVSRAGEGLPEGAFVYACASHHYKITPEVWSDWCRIVTLVPGSVLWLVDDTPEGKAELSRRWAEAGLAPERLIFAPRVDPGRYRARMALADLFLDTSPYNAGTIASDALRMGLPVLTMAGNSFVARMGTSLLTAVGLTGCIATDRDDYVGRAVRIGHGRGPKGLLSGRALAQAWALTLGDAADFTRRFEAAMKRVRLRP